MKTLSFDTEDKGLGTDSVTMIGFFDGERYTIIQEATPERTKIAACSFLKANPGKYYTFNLEYDILNIFWPDTDKISFIRAGSRMIYARYSRCHFYDLVYIGLIGMGKSAPYVGMKKGELNADDPEYLKNDLKITYAWTLKLRTFLRRRFPGVKFKSTLAGISLEVFKQTWRRFELPEKSDMTFIRQSFYGGRTEAFRMGRTLDCVYSDINSLYPSVMAENSYPAIGGYYFDRQIIEDHYIVDATVTCPKMFLPVLPVRHDKKLFFPVGTFRGVWCKPEFEKALEIGYKVVRVHRAMNFPHKIAPFGEFVNTIYQMRGRASNDFERYFFKILMNALYGKFATGKELVRCYGFLDDLGVKVIDTTPPYANVVWSSFITSYARVKLYSMLDKIPPNMLVYSDTDSIICKSEGFAHLEDQVGAGLGSLKIEARLTWIDVKGLKLYSYQDFKGNVYHAVKGVPFDDQEYYFLFGESSFKKPNRMKEAIRRNEPPNKWETVTKKIRSSYDKRVILKGGMTRPVCLSLTNK